MNSISRAAAITFVAVLGGCAAPAHAPVVNAGDSTPAAERPADPFARVDDRTDVVAYEFGRCEFDTDCVLDACEGSMCAPRGEDAICLVTPVSDCLATVDASMCGCNEGFCRWARTAPVLICAQLGSERAGTRPFRGTDPDAWYPTRPH